jgi:hypothetical protein
MAARQTRELVRRERCRDGCSPRVDDWSPARGHIVDHRSDVQPLVNICRETGADVHAVRRTVWNPVLANTMV